MIRRLLHILILGICLTSCGVVKRGTIPWEERAKEQQEIVAEPENTVPVAASVTEMPASSSNLSRSDRKIRESLDLAYNDWRGVPYLLGGKGYNGVDCSSFMQIVFEDYFQINLPRNTRDQMKEGSSVRRNQWKLGDMVFFKTGRDAYHVGVMISDHQFLHASTSSGVMISSMTENYWDDRYLTTRRIL